MKKNRLFDYLARAGWKKCVRIMKLTTFLVLLFVIDASASFSQSTKISVKVENGTLSEIFSKIEEQSEYRFFYQNEQIRDSGRKTVDATDKNVLDVMNELLMETGLSFKLIDRNIIVFPKSENPMGKVIRQQKSVSGKVTDSSGQPIPGASVVIKGTTTGTITDTKGVYSLSNISENTILQISFIGMKSRNIPVGSKSVIDIVLEPDNQAIGEVVVTALGMKREKKALGFAMQEVKGESLDKPRTSIAEALQGEIAGAQISSNATGPGGSTRIVLRGQTGLTAGSPLWVIDGMPVKGNTTGGGGWGGGSDDGGGINDLNLDNVESVSVLKGANASALYGSRAKNGVIVITTKRANSEEITVEYKGVYTWEAPYDQYEFQYQYGQGTKGAFNVASQFSWGGKLDGSVVQHWRNKYWKDLENTEAIYAPQGNFLNQFYKTGHMYNNTVTVSGGTTKLKSIVSVTDSRNTGITPRHEYNRTNINTNTNFSSKFLDVNVGVNIVRATRNNIMSVGDEGAMKWLVMMPNNINLDDLSNLVDPLTGYTVNYVSSNNRKNPFLYVTKGNDSQSVRNRFIGRAEVIVKFTDYLRLTGRASIDYNVSKSSDQTTLTLATRAIYDQSYSTDQSWGQDVNMDLMLNFNKRYHDFNIIANGGISRYQPKGEGLSAKTVGGFTIPGLAILRNSAQNITASESYSTQRLNSVLGNASFGFRDYVYLELTGRNDWSSTLPMDSWSYFYPSVSMSGIFSDMFELPEPISFLKGRVSWARVGSATSPYQLKNEYSIGTIPNYGTEATPNSSFPITNLKPQMMESTEGGIEMRMFDNRLGLDVTYYDAQTTNQILSVQTALSSGYKSALINAGKVVSKGWEVTLTGTPVQTRNWEWTNTLNWGKNKSECVELVEGVNYKDMGSTRNVYVRCMPGHQFGEIVGDGYSRDENGNKLIGDNGMPIKDPLKIVGNISPDWTGSFMSSLKWKSFNLRALVDIKSGGDFISFTDVHACYAGTSAKTLDRENGIVVDGIVKSTGVVNTANVTLQDYYTNICGSNGYYPLAEEFMRDASFVKMRQLSLAYSFPKKLYQNLPVNQIKLSVVGSNLFYFWKAADVNPEGSYSTSDEGQAFEYCSLPPTRSFGFSVNVNF